MKSGFDVQEIESVVRAVAARLGAAEGAAAPSAVSDGRVLVLCGAWASASDAAAAAGGSGFSAFDPRGRKFAGAARVLADLPEEPIPWLRGFERACVAVPDLGLLQALARLDCSVPLVDLACALVGLGIPVFLPPPAANPLWASLRGELSAEAARLLRKAASLGFAVEAPAGRKSPAAKGSALPASPAAGEGIDYSDRKLLTAVDAEALSRGACLRLGPRALVTPAAADVLRERRIRVERSS